MKAFGRYELASTAAIGIALILAALLLAFAVAAFTRTPTPGAMVAALGFLTIAASSLLYASRLGAGSLGD